MELVTGFAGQAHVDPIDMAHVNAVAFGHDAYLLDTQNKLEPTLETANKLVVDTGDLMIQGHHFTVVQSEEIALQSGVSGQKRNALVCARYEKAEGTGIESASWIVKYGEATTGTPADPEVTTGNILDGINSVHEEPIYRIEYDGITPGNPILLVPEFQSNASFRTSIDQRSKVFTGSKSFGPISGTSVLLFSAAEFEETFGRTYNNSKDFVGVMNGDGASSNCHVDGAQWSSGTGVYATFDRTLSSAWVRVTYVVVLGA